MCNPVAYHYRAFDIENQDLAPKISTYSPLILKIITSCFFKLLSTQCATRQHNMLEYFTQNSDSARYILQEALNRHDLLETGNIQLHVENSCLFSFMLNCCCCCFYLSSNWFQSVSHLEIGFGTPNFPGHLIEMEFNAKKRCP